MPDLNDVVRHVILRLIVDQGGLGDELAAARAKLKGLQDAEKLANRERIKDSDRVTEAISRQKQAIADNAKAHEGYQRATTSGNAADLVKQRTAAIKEQTAEIKKQIVEEAKAAEIRQRTADAAADRQQARDQRRLDKRQQRQQSGDESKARLDRTEQLTKESQQRIERADAQHQETLRRNANRTAQQAIQDEEKTRRERSKTAAQIITDADRVARTQENAANRATRASEAEASKVRRGMVGQQRKDERFSDFQGKVDRELRAMAQGRADDEIKIRHDTQNRIEAIEKAGLGLKKTLMASEEKIETDALKRIEEERKRVKQASARSTIGSSLRQVLGAGFSAATRSVTSTPFRQAVRATATSRRERSLAFDAAGIESEAKRAESALGRLFASIRQGGRGAANIFRDLGAGIKAFASQVDKPLGGGGGGNFNNFLRGFSDFADNLGSSMLGLGKGMLSFKGVILAVIIALGPLAAMLGAVGAAALGLVGNIANLSGALFALPGILGSLVAGFGALALVMQPLQNVFAAHTAAQKANARATQEAKNALLDHKAALIDEERAELANQRAKQDLPRSYEKLAQARQDAARKIQDYRLALQKLKFDEEGGELGVLSAEQKLRRALADPTANNLDRRIAKHDVEGALLDQRDQKVAGGRLKEDSSAAFKKGVEGSNEVIDAMRGVQDAVLDVDDSYLRWQKSILAVNKAAREAKAGGSAAATFQAEIDKLPPQTRKVAKAIIDLMDGPFKKMRDRLSEKIFGPMAGDTDKFAGIVEALGKFLTPAATALGNLADQALRLFTNSDWKKFWGEQGEESGKIFGTLGGAALDVADGFRSITEVARPFTEFVVNGIGGMAKHFKEFAASKDGRKQIADFLDVTKRTMKELAPVVKDFAGGFVSFLTALNDSSGANKGQSFISWFNEGLRNIAGNFKALGDKAKDPNGGFQKWLRDVRPLLKDVVGFIGDVAGFFGKLFSDTDNIKEAQAILDAIGNKLLPTLSKFFEDLSKSHAISSIINFVVNMADAAEKFAKWVAVPAVTTFFSVLSAAASKVAWFFEMVDKVPVLASGLKALGTAIGFLAGAALLTRIGAMISKVTGLTGLIGSIKGGKSGDLDTRSGGRKAWDWVTGNKPDTKLDGPNGVLPIMRVMEGHLAQIVRLLGGRPSAGAGGNRPGGPDDDDSRRSRRHRRQGGPGGANIPDDDTSSRRRVHRRRSRWLPPADDGGFVSLGGDDDGESTTRYGRRRGRRATRRHGRGLGGLAGFAGAGLAGAVPFGAGIGGGDYDDGYDDGYQDATGGGMYDVDLPDREARDGGRHRRGSTARGRGGRHRPGRVPQAGSHRAPRIRGGRLGGLGRLGGRLGRASGLLGRAGGSLARGIGGGLIGAAISLTAGLAADAATDKFVKDDEDAASLHRGIGAVATGAGIGGMIGTALLPGVGTVIGGTLGGLAGGAYSLVKDKNLRSFVGGKLQSGVKGVGGFVSRAAKGVGGFVSNLFGGDDDDKAGGAGGGKSGGLLGGVLGGAVAGPIGALVGGTGIGGKILDSLKGAGKGIGDFFTKTIPGWWSRGVSAITGFFTKTLPSLPGKAFDAITTGFGVLLGFFRFTLPRAASAAWHGITNFFTKTLPHAASVAWAGITRFIRSIPGFFTKTIPNWFRSVRHWVGEHISKPVIGFVTKTIPHFFTETIPRWFKQVPHWFKYHVKDPVVEFFTEKVPKFFTETLPNAIKKLPGFLYDHLVKPILDFFGGVAEHVGDFLKGSWNWAKSLFSRGAKNVQSGMDSQKKMSGGLIEGIYQGIEDRVHVLATPGEYYIRRGAVQQPQGKRFLDDFNEGRFNPADWYAGLTDVTNPRVPSAIPVNAAFQPSKPLVVNNNVNSGLSIGDITINNPRRETAEHSLRRQIQIAAIRHKD